MLQQNIAPTAAKVSNRGLKRRLRLGERVIEGWIFLAGLLAIVVLLGIIFILLKEGLPIFANTPPWEFLLRHALVSGLRPAYIRHRALLCVHFNDYADFYGGSRARRGSLRRLIYPR